MTTRHWLPLVGMMALLFGGLVVLLIGVSAAPAATVEGIVVDLEGTPVAGAVVRQQTTTHATTSAADGSFMLSGLPQGISVTVTA